MQTRVFTDTYYNTIVGWLVDNPILISTDQFLPPTAMKLSICLNAAGSLWSGGERGGMEQCEAVRPAFNPPYPGSRSPTPAFNLRSGFLPISLPGGLRRWPCSLPHAAPKQVCMLSLKATFRLLIKCYVAVHSMKFMSVTHKLDQYESASII